MSWGKIKKLDFTGGTQTAKIVASVARAIICSVITELGI